MKILIVEDEPKTVAYLRKGLTEQGYAVDFASDGENGLHLAQTLDYDAVILDVMLPKLDGIALLERLRNHHQTPVIMLTARDSVDDRLRGLGAGADDYLVKPFDLNELSARIRALLRRRSGRSDAVITHRGVSLTPATRHVSVNGHDVTLPAREFHLLHALLERPGAVLSREQLREKLYAWGDEIESNTIEVFVHSLRKRLGADYIVTVRGVGYAVISET